MSNDNSQPSRSAKLIQIIDDTIQILVDDFDLMQDDEYEEPTEINAEEIIYDVIKVLEDCGDPEACLEMIVPVVGALQKYMINLADKANVFLVQLFLHLTQTCLTGIKGEYLLPKSIVKHIMEVIIEKLPKDEGLLVERAFLLGALIQNCQIEDTEVLQYLSLTFLVPMFKQDLSDEVMEALTGCLTDASGIFKEEFRDQPELLQTLIERATHSPDKQREALFSALGDIALSGGMPKEQIGHIFEVVSPILPNNNVPRGLRMSIVQMHTCIFNSLSEEDADFTNKVVSYLFRLIDFVVIGVDSDESMSKQHMKDNLSLLLDIGVLYGKSEYFADLKSSIWNQRTIPLFTRLKSLLEDTKTDQQTLLYFDNVLTRIFKSDFASL